jgi:hypothetical protein
VQKGPFFFQILSRPRLVVAIAPEFTMGFVNPCGCRSTAAKELKGYPVDSLSWPMNPALWAYGGA